MTFRPLSIAAVLATVFVAALCTESQSHAQERGEYVLVSGGPSPFNILRSDACRRQTNNGHKLTKIVSCFRQRATKLTTERRYSMPSFLMR